MKSEWKALVERVVREGDGVLRSVGRVAYEEYIDMIFCRSSVNWEGKKSGKNLCAADRPT